MAEHLSSHSTFVEMEVPDVSTPNWPAVHSQNPQESYVPTFCHTPSQFRCIAQPGAHVQFAFPPVGGSTPAQNFPQEMKNPEPMQLCTPPHKTHHQPLLLPLLLHVQAYSMNCLELFQRLEERWVTSLHKHKVTGTSCMIS